MRVFNYQKKKRISRFLLLSMLVCFGVCGLDPCKAGEADDFSTTGTVSITFRDTDMREVLNILAYKGGVNIIAGDDVTAKVSVQLKDVPWENALDAILKTYNFTYKKEGKLLRVMSLQRALDEETKVPLTTKIIPLNFADVEELKASLAKVLSKRGSITVDKRTNSLIITDIPDVVDKVEAAAIALDTDTPQVLIEAMMVDVKITKDERRGVNLLVDEKGSGNYYQHVMENSSLENRGVFEFSAVLDALNLSALLDLWQQENRAEILANPKVLTLDNQEAKIEITEEIPYFETVDSGSGTTTNVKFKEAGIKLYVTPHITSGNFISMNVKPEQSFKSAEILDNPVIDYRKAETNLLVKDGQTIVIGGLRKVNDTVTYDKIPGFGDIPFFGLFFKKKVISKVETELMIFVTPHIIGDTRLTDKEIDMFLALDQKKPLTIDEDSELERFDGYMNKRKEKRQAKEIAASEAARRKKMMGEEGLTLEEQDEKLLREVLSTSEVPEDPKEKEDVKRQAVAMERKKVLDIEEEQLKEILGKVKTAIEIQGKATGEVGNSENLTK
ncbi:MAG: type IV pilus secretin PilQ [Candidatus Omnitrophota bacterium]